MQHAWRNSSKSDEQLIELAKRTINNRSEEDLDAALLYCLRFCSESWAIEMLEGTTALDDHLPSIIVRFSKEIGEATVDAEVVLILRVVQGICEYVSPRVLSSSSSSIVPLLLTCVGCASAATELKVDTIRLLRKFFDAIDVVIARQYGRLFFSKVSHYLYSQECEIQEQIQPLLAHLMLIYANEGFQEFGEIIDRFIENLYFLALSCNDGRGNNELILVALNNIPEIIKILKCSICVYLKRLLPSIRKMSNVKNKQIHRAIVNCLEVLWSQGGPRIEFHAFNVCEILFKIIISKDKESRSRIIELVDKIERKVPKVSRAMESLRKSEKVREKLIVELETVHAG